jgi:hypothetical protein
MFDVRARRKVMLASQQAKQAPEAAEATA